MTQTEFIAHVRSLAAEVPGLNPEATAAHAANESRFGQSELAAGYGNLFGVKAGAGWTGATVDFNTWEVVNGENVMVKATFRAYESWRSSLEDYAELVARLYPWAAQHADNPLAWLTGIFLLGPRKWATDPAAYTKAVAILDKFGLLYRPVERERLGEHAVIVDNSPTVGKAMTTLTAALSRRPAVHGPAIVTRTRRPDGSWKLDTRDA